MPLCTEMLSKDRNPSDKTSRRRVVIIVEITVPDDISVKTPLISHLLDTIIKKKRLWNSPGAKPHGNLMPNHPNIPTSKLFVFVLTFKQAAHTNQLW